MNGSKAYLRFIVIIAFLFTINIYSQNIRILYQYQYAIDSLNIENKTEEKMLLDITENKSYFYSRAKYLNDSISYYSGKKQTPYKSKVDYFILKISLNEIFVNKTIGINDFVYNEPSLLKWSIHSETKEILGNTTQKAMCDFGGRKWIAWFTSKIPIQNGPDVFSGLPGLILEISDNKNHHNFKILSIENHKIDSEITKPNKIKISKKEFADYWTRYKLDPTADFKALATKSNIKFEIQWGGEKFSQKEIYKMQEERAKKDFLLNNNYLDLNLYRSKTK